MTKPLLQLFYVLIMAILFSLIKKYVGFEVAIIVGISNIIAIQMMQQQIGKGQHE